MIDLAALTERPTAPVLLVSPDAVKTASRLLPAYVVMSYEHKDRGALEPLAGRKVDVWPDATDYSRELFAKCAELLLSLKCAVRAVNPNGAAEGWNITQANQDGMGTAEVLAFARAHLSVVERPAAPDPDEEMPPIDESDIPPPDYADSVDSGADAIDTPPKPRGRPPAKLDDSQALTVQSWNLANTDGKPHCNISNVITALGAARAAGDGFEIWFDEFANQIQFSTQVGEIKPWQDVDTIRLTVWLQERAGMVKLHSATVREAILAYATQDRRNNVRDWFDIVELQGWDGVNRLMDLCPIGFGSDATDYAAAVGRCFMVGMVARVFKPGCKVDSMPVFEGSQGVGKSSALRVIGGRWFAETHEKVTSKDFYIALQNKLLIEISELAAFRRGDIERIKGVVSCQSDRYRAPYGHYAADYPRMCVFAGTTNADDWNADSTGARRFWPIRCGQVNLKWLTDNRTQLFAEAIARYKRGEPWWDVPTAAAQAEQDERRTGDPWTEKVAAVIHLERQVSIAGVLDALGLPVERQSLAEYWRIGSILRDLGWFKTVSNVNGKLQKVWRPKVELPQ